jgi:hypothetical protein
MVELPVVGCDYSEVSKYFVGVAEYESFIKGPPTTYSYVNLAIQFNRTSKLEFIQPPASMVSILQQYHGVDMMYGDVIHGLIYNQDDYTLHDSSIFLKYKQNKKGGTCTVI